MNENDDLLIMKRQGNNSQLSINQLKQRGGDVMEGIKNHKRNFIYEKIRKVKQVNDLQEHFYNRNELSVNLNITEEDLEQDSKEDYSVFMIPQSNHEQANSPVNFIFKNARSALRSEENIRSNLRKFQQQTSEQQRQTQALNTDRINHGEQRLNVEDISDLDIME